jgi:predicted RNase H-like HicB family nuclease
VTEDFVRGALAYYTERRGVRFYVRGDMEYNNRGGDDFMATSGAEKMTRTRTFTIIIHMAEEGGYYAECPVLPGCVTQGDTLDELKNNMSEAIALWLEDDEYPRGVSESVLALDVEHA